VIAERRFAKGDVLIRAEGFIYDETEQFDDTYALVLSTDDLPGVKGSQIFYDLVDQSRWINHSCEPNSHVESAIDEATGRPVAWWEATRDIEPGEELFYDYAFVGTVAEPCGCGAPACRGLIVDPDPAELAQVPEKLRKHLRIPMPDTAAPAAKPAEKPADKPMRRAG
jgi:hypothetical protein